MATKTNMEVIYLPFNEIKLNSLINGVNKRIEHNFEKQAMAHKDIFGLIQEVENGIPTKLECRAYEELKHRFHDLFLYLNI